MFVLKNAWAALGRVKWRTALTALLALLVSFSAAVDLAVLRADDKANNETYQSQKASAVIRPSAKVTAKRDGADSNYTANYMTWDMYTKYAEAVQKNNLTFEYTLATSVPVRASKSLQAIAAKSDTSEDNTGGNLTLQAFYTNDAAKINDYGTFKVVKGKQLNYKTANDGVLVSQAVAKKNNLKVGDKVTVGNPTKASETYKFTVRGIYEYTGETPAGYGSDAKYAKDNRENVVYTSYINFAQSGLDVAGTKGWAIPNLNIIFTLTDPATYNKFVRLVTKAKLDTSKFTISSPSLDAYKKRIAPLDAAAKAARQEMMQRIRENKAGQGPRGAGRGQPPARPKPQAPRTAAEGQPLVEGAVELNADGTPLSAADQPMGQRTGRTRGREDVVGRIVHVEAAVEALGHCGPGGGQRQRQCSPCPLLP